MSLAPVAASSKSAKSTDDLDFLYRLFYNQSEFVDRTPFGSYIDCSRLYEKNHFKNIDRNYVKAFKFTTYVSNYDSNLRFKFETSIRLPNQNILDACVEIGIRCTMEYRKHYRYSKYY